ncbi:hypothetical protein CAOG_04405 [Capsaspora owczarzaki ATCC 30864]|uniref:hypothetical protein n=1 Tax=Capsaspora owczarzaki (strain ATCC 30864) TaxID=595528 RepID=UPI0001FE4A56|nr:hypothetical protein CAOG_04405 [Capsaspora owczarzaki ATCC 30864]|eukprot:XP_004348233.1 hypothetical protein CAOG_04405 [Capsaspora owczarzaki ATCC 30864]
MPHVDQVLLPLMFQVLARRLTRAEMANIRAGNSFRFSRRRVKRWTDGRRWGRGYRLASGSFVYKEIDEHGSILRNGLTKVVGEDDDDTSVGTVTYSNTDNNAAELNNFVAPPDLFAPLLNAHARANDEMLLPLIHRLIDLLNVNVADNINPAPPPIAEAPAIVRADVPFDLDSLLLPPFLNDLVDDEPKFADLFIDNVNFDAPVQPADSPMAAGLRFMLDSPVFQ